MMLHLLAKNWWLLMLRGVAAILFGILAFAWPGLTLYVLVIFYGAYALADGVFALTAAIVGGGMAPRWWLAIVGLLGIGAGLGTFFYPGVTIFVLVYLIGGWSIARGLMEIVGAIQLRKEIENEWMLILSGLLSLLFGILVLASPGSAAMALVWVLGIYAVVFGLLMITLSLKLKKHRAAMA